MASWSFDSQFANQFTHRSSYCLLLIFFGRSLFLLTIGSVGIYASYAFPFLKGAINLLLFYGICYDFPKLEVISLISPDYPLSR